MKTPRKHAELIKAWADGAEIEVKTFAGNWNSLENIGWHPNNEYRIKPEPKPDVVLYAWVDEFKGIDFYSVDLCGNFNQTQFDTDNLKLTFNGETNKLIKAEVI